MDKIVGNYWLCLPLLLSLSISADLSLQVTDMQGQEVQNVQAGEPFLMSISVTNSDEQIEPQIKGMQDFFVKRIGQQLMIVNGVKSAQYNYQIRIDKIGTYTIGPAYYPGSQERSKTVRIKVEAETNHAAKKLKDSSGQSDLLMLQLWSDNDEVYVGQKIKTALRFYVPEDQKLSIEQVVAEDPDTITVTEKVGPKKGAREINGTRYHFYEWQWDMFAQKAGQLVIPAYSLDFSKLLPMDHSFGGLAAFLGPRYEHKRIYSNALTLKVRPLPDTDKQVDAVGHFTHIHADINATVAKQYEGMVLSLFIEGSGDMQALQAPTLNIPEGLKWYPSKSYIEDQPSEQRKTFEYIIQGLKPGEYEIGQQAFTFFDVETASYRQLKTAPLFVTILPGQAVSPIASDDTNHKEVPEDADNQKLNATTYSIIEQFSAMRAPEGIPYSWMLLFLLLPLIIIFGHAAYGSSSVIYHMLPGYDKRRTFSSAKKEVADARNDHKAERLYPIFLHLFAMRMQRAVETLSLQDIDDFVEQTDLKEEYKSRLHSFMLCIMEIAYAGSSDRKESATVFEQAKFWLDELEGVV